MFYRFNNGSLVEADNFKDAQEILCKRIMREKENPERWKTCGCTGFQCDIRCPNHNWVD